jgi:energy-coupling factor transporter transmembrane protein EcfT
LLALAAISISSLSAGGVALVLACTATAAGIHLARCPLLACFVALKWYVVLLFCVVVARTLTMPGDPLLPDGVVSAIPLMKAQAMSRQGLVAGLLLALRLLLVALLGLLLTLTTRPSHLRAAVEWFLAPVPLIPHRQVATMIGLLVRFIPVILNQAAEVGEALRARAIDNRVNPWRRMTALAMPLLRRTFVTADRLAMAMEARCYGNERTAPSFQLLAGDWWAMGVVVLLCLGLVVLP